MHYTSGSGIDSTRMIVETPEFIGRIEKLLDDEERDALIGYLAANPTAGDVIPGTGGVRKLRWGLEGAANAAVRASSISFTVRDCRCS